MILCIGTTPAAQRVMVFGRLVPNAVNRATTTIEGAAGKSVNVAKVLKALGSQPVATGFLGGDRGAFVRTALETRGIVSGFIVVAAPTRQCITVIDESTGTITELVEESHPVAPSDYERLLATIGRLIGPGSATGHASELRDSMHAQSFQQSLAADIQAVVMSGTITPNGPVDFYLRSTEIAHAAGALSIVDAKGPILLETLKAQPGLVKPNRTELAATVGHDLADESAVISAMRELRQRGAQRVVVTAGKDPALAIDGRQLWRIHSPKVAAVNPIGSGDAFTAGLVWRLVRGDDLGEACRWGAAAGVANALTLMPGDLELPTVERLVREVKVELK